jgi:predicted O-methyltransferase YrrM
LAKKIKAMYPTFTLIKKYIQYYVNASNGKGHGVHSPFVFQFIQEVLLNKEAPKESTAIEQKRAALLTDHTILEVWDRGAGSRQNNQSKRAVKQIAAAALKSKKYAHLLAKIVDYFQPENIIEMGTSLGITTCYLAKSAKSQPVFTMEGAPAVANWARKTMADLHVDNAQIIEGDFNQTLPDLLEKLDRVGMAYIDGNHQYIPTMQYFRDLLKKSDEQSFFIFDDIHWSEEMEKAWEEIKQDSAVSLTIDLFYIGLVFFRKENKEPMHYTIRY